jgi:hypothetical protein
MAGFRKQTSEAQTNGDFGSLFVLLNYYFADE